jgi:hypothetical protein
MKKIYNDDVIFSRVVAVMLCATIVFIPLSLCWLYSLRNPADILSGTVTNKKSTPMSVGKGFGVMYDIMINNAIYRVSANIYEALFLGDYASVAHRKGLIYYIIK